MLLLPFTSSSLLSIIIHHHHHTHYRPPLLRLQQHSSIISMMAANNNNKEGPPWQPSPRASSEDISLAKSLSISPLDDANVNLLNEVRHRNYVNPKPLEMYDLVVIGAGAGGLVSSRQVSCQYVAHIYFAFYIVTFASYTHLMFLIIIRQHDEERKVA